MSIIVACVDLFFDFTYILTPALTLINLRGVYANCFFGALSLAHVSVRALSNFNTDEPLKVKVI